MFQFYFLAKKFNIWNRQLQDCVFVEVLRSIEMVDGLRCILFYLMQCCELLTVVCPPSAMLNITQNAPARRPRDNIVLSCVLSGVESAGVVVYRWIIVETKALIYEFSVKFTSLL